MSIWDAADTPIVASANDPASVELGVKFQSEVSGHITGIRFYKGSANTGTHSGHLWTSGGSLLASATFTNETATGWQEQLLAGPVMITSNTTYVASYHAPNGGYALNTGYFSTGGETNPPLKALADGEDGGNGVFTYGPTASFPASTFDSANYWVDVVFTESLGPDTNAPVVVGVSPTNGATGVSVNTTVNVTFNEAMDAGTITSNTVVLVDSGTNAVAASVSYDGGTLTATLTPDSALGLLETYAARVVSGAVGVKDVEGNELASDYVWSFTTTDTLALSIWDDTFTPATPNVNDGAPLTLGVKFQSAVGGYVTGIRFYKGASNAAPHIGRLWTVSGGDLGSVTFSNETASGWQEQLLGTPVAISSNTTYVASCYSSSGWFSLDGGYFNGQGYASGPLRALADGEDGGNGVFTSGDTFPTDTFNAANYWVDLVFTESLGPDTNAPVVVGVGPTNGSTGVSVSTPVSVTFNEAMDVGTITSNTVVLVDSGSNAVGTSVSYDGGTLTATLTPDSALGLLETYTARVVSGAGGVKDVAGNELASDFVWSFTTTDNPYLSIWDDSVTPAVPSVAEFGAIELGVKFQSELDGYIVGIRFYKGPTNSGTHVGNLWTVGGSNLASATFSGETPSGWQEQLLASPVAIASNTTYVASYHAPNGGYSVDPGFFSGGGATNYPLRALADGEQGGNGVFAEGVAGTFPTSTFNGNNYWVDVLFSQIKPNLAPTASNLLAGTPEDISTNLVLQGSDPEGAVSFEILDPATNGILTGLDTNTGNVLYTPGLNYFGPDYFTYTVSDGELAATGSVSITITPVNDAPVATGLDVSTPEDTSTNLVLAASDVDNANLLYSLVDGPTNGLVSGFDANSGALIYTPVKDFHGSDSIRYSVSDGALLDTGLVSVTVIPVDDPPKAIDQNVSLFEDNSTNLTLVAADIDTIYNLTETLAVSDISVPDDWGLGAGVGKVSAVALNDGNSSYIASGTTANTRQQFQLTDSASMRGKDLITSVTLRATAKRESLNASYRLSTVIASDVQAGGTQTAKNNYVQTTSDFGSRPGGGGWELTDVADLEVRIQNLQSRSVRCTQLDAVVNYQSDINTTNVIYAILDPPTNGLLGGLDPVTGALTYTPGTNYSGEDAFRFTATIDSVVSTGLVLIGVSPVNDAPVFAATPGDVSVVELALLTVTNDAFDIDLPPQLLTYQLIDPPSGALINTDGVITWTPTVAQGPATNVLGTVVDDGQLSATNFFTVTVLDLQVIPEILAISAVNGVVSLTWSSVNGQSYLLEYNDSLNMTNWTPLPPAIQATGTTASATNLTSGAAQRFYRVKVE